MIDNIFRSNQNFDFTVIPILDNKKDVLPDGHPNNFGHEKISEEILKILLAEYFKDCKF